MMESILAELSKLTHLMGAGMAVAAAGAAAYFLAARGLKSLQARRYLPDRLVTTFRRIILWVVAGATLLLLLQTLGVLQSVMAAVTGVFALLAIGFVAVWSVLSNTLCSLILMIIRPYRVGDTLSLPPDNLCGKVVNFNLIFTTLETEDGYLLQVPNNIFFQRPVVRKVGKWKIGLADQLYEPKNATGEPRKIEEPPGETRKDAKPRPPTTATALRPWAAPQFRADTLQKTTCEKDAAPHPGRRLRRRAPALSARSVPYRLETGS